MSKAFWLQEDEMFTERELLILSFVLDNYQYIDGSFFTAGERNLLLQKIHNVLRAERQMKMESQNG